MTHDTTDDANGSMGSGQAEFLGWLGLALIGLMALFALTLFLSAAASGFK